MAEKKYEIHRVKDEERYTVGKELYRGLRKVDASEMLLAGANPLYGCVQSVAGTPDVWQAREKKSGLLIAAWGIKRVELEDVRKLTGLTAGGAEAGTLDALTRGRLVWCLGTTRVASHHLAFAMESRRILMRWARKYGVLWNYVATFNRDALAWLAWCGAEFYELPAWKDRKERFVRFEIRAGKNEREA